MGSVRTTCSVSGALLALLLVGGDPARAAEMPGYQRLTPVTEGLEAPTAVAFDTSENLYVTESSRGRVSAFGSGGELLRSIGPAGKPISVAVGGDGSVYVGDDEQGAVEVYSPELVKKGVLGSGAGEFRHPTGVVVDRSGNVYVCDGKEDRVEVFGPDRAAKFGFGGTGSGDGQLTNPTAVAVWDDGGEFYVADQPVLEPESGGLAGVRVQVFDLSGRFKRSFGSFGRGDGYLVRPAGLAVDRLGRVYVTDSYQNVVQVFDGQGVFLGTLFDAAQPLRTPLGIALAAGSGRLAVASLFSGKVEMYSLQVPPAHRITISVTGNGKVEPAGPVVAVEDRGAVVFTLTPDPGHHIEGARLDGQPLTVTGHTAVVGNVRTDVVFEALFAEDPEPEPVVWTVSARAEGGGTIDPSGTLQVLDGEGVVFTLAAEPGNELQELRVDGTDVKAASETVTTYVLAGVHANHEVVAVYGPIPVARPKVWKIIAKARERGRIVPSGTVVVEGGRSQRFRFEPEPGYRVEAVLVDGKLIAVSGDAYTFASVRTDHEIEVVFGPRGTASSDPGGSPDGSGTGEGSAEPRFVDHGDGTLTDVETGLMWPKDANCAAARWVSTGGALAWEEALAWVRELNTAGGECARGYDDWRLPNVNELRSILHAGYSQEPCGETAWCETAADWLEEQGFLGLGGGLYWSSTTRVTSRPVSAWGVDFEAGTVAVEAKVGSGYVWPVRTAPGGLAGRARPVWKTGQEACYAPDGEPRACARTGQDGEQRAGLAWPVPRFTAHGDGTVSDAATGLMWLQDYGCLGTAPASNAPAKVMGLNVSPTLYRSTCRGYTASYHDWALPTQEEKLGITDFSQEEPSLPPLAPLLGVTARGYWEQDGGRAAAAPWDPKGDRHVWPVRTPR